MYYIVRQKGKKKPYLRPKSDKIRVDINFLTSMGSLYIMARSSVPMTHKEDHKILCTN